MNGIVLFARKCYKRIMNFHLIKAIFENKFLPRGENKREQTRARISPAFFDITSNWLAF